MKKHFYNRNLVAGIAGVSLMGAGSLFFFAMMAASIVFCIQGDVEFVLYATISFVFCVVCAWTMRILSLKGLSKLTIKENLIVWSCPFHNSKKVLLNECQYIEIVDMIHHYRLPLIRGDEASFIWISTQQFPSQFQHQADCIKCKDGSIIFPYSDKLAEELMRILPQEKTNRLGAFYHRMKQKDRLLRHIMKRPTGTRNK